MKINTVLIMMQLTKSKYQDLVFYMKEECLNFKLIKLIHLILFMSIKRKNTVIKLI